MPDVLREDIQQYTVYCFQHHDERVLKARENILEAIRTTITVHSPSSELQITKYVAQRSRKTVSLPIVCIAWQELHRILLEKQSMRDNMIWKLTEELKMEVILAFTIELCYRQFNTTLKVFAAFIHNPENSETIRILRTENMIFRRYNKNCVATGDASSGSHVNVDEQLDFIQLMCMFHKLDHVQQHNQKVLSKNAPVVSLSEPEESWIRSTCRKLLQAPFMAVAAVLSGFKDIKDLSDIKNNEDDQNGDKMSFFSCPHFEENVDTSTTSTVASAGALQHDILYDLKESLRRASTLNYSIADSSNYQWKSIPNQSRLSNVLIDQQSPNHGYIVSNVVNSSSSSKEHQFSTVNSYLKHLSTVVRRIILESSNAFNEEIHIPLSMVVCCCISPCSILLRGTKKIILPVGQHVLLIYDPDKLPHRAASNDLGFFSELFLSISLHEWVTSNS